MKIIKSYEDFLLENNSQNVEKLEDLVANKLTCTIDYAIVTGKQIGRAHV